MKVKVAQSCLTLRAHGLYSPWNPSGRNTGAGGCFLLQGIFPNPGIEPRSPALQADALTSEPPGKPLILFIAETYIEITIALG